MGDIFGSKAKDAADKLSDAVYSKDVDASLRILEEAGGACQARAVAQEAKGKNKNFFDYSVVVSGDKETLTVYRAGIYGDFPVAGIEQPRCKK